MVNLLQTIPALPLVVMWWASWFAIPLLLIGILFRRGFRILPGIGLFAILFLILEVHVLNALFDFYIGVFEIGLNAFVLGSIGEAFMYVLKRKGVNIQSKHEILFVVFLCSILLVLGNSTLVPTGDVFR